MRAFIVIVTFTFVVALAGLAAKKLFSPTDDDVDGAVAAAIANIHAIDNHCHGEPASADRGSNWSLDDPIGKPAYPDVLPLRRDSPDWILPWRALYGYRYNDMRSDHLRALLETKIAMMRKAGESWPVQILDKAGIEIAFINARISVRDRRTRGFAGFHSPIHCCGHSSEQKAACPIRAERLRLHS
jgi:hypothetical protein